MNKRNQDDDDLSDRLAKHVRIGEVSDAKEAQTARIHTSKKRPLNPPTIYTEKQAPTMYTEKQVDAKIMSYRQAEAERLRHLVFQHSQELRRQKYELETLCDHRIQMMFSPPNTSYIS